MRASESMETMRLEGECDLYSAGLFLNAARERMERGTRRMLIDCSSLSYLDSTGVGAIVRVLQHMKSLGGLLFFKGLKGSPRKVLELCNVIVLLREVSEE